MANETNLVGEAPRSGPKPSMVKTLLGGEPSNLSIYTYTIINKKLQTATSGLQKYLYKQLTEQVSKENSLTIADFILTQKIEVNLF